MRKGLFTGSLLVFVLLAAYLAAGAPAEPSTAAPRFTPAPIFESTSVSEIGDLMAALRSSVEVAKQRQAKAAKSKRAG